MKANQAGAVIGAILTISILFVGLFAVPERTWDLVTILVITVPVTVIILRATGLEDIRFEGFAQVANLGARNAFVYLMFMIPIFALLTELGTISMPIVPALWLLWVSAFSLAWFSIIYYFRE
ncbi:MAG: hypothetical protein ACFE7R_07130 [Candidatus Hodarchaeota archaeon]